jgi:hypothetical protein
VSLFTQSRYSVGLDSMSGSKVRKSVVTTWVVSDAVCLQGGSPGGHQPVEPRPMCVALAPFSNGDVNATVAPH